MTPRRAPLCLFPVAFAVVLAGCAGSVAPIGTASSYKEREIGGCETEDGFSPTLSNIGQPAASAEDARGLRWISCELRAKSVNAFKQSQSLWNRNEWRDLPIIGAALTVAGLFLFGERNPEGNLTAGEMDVVEGIGLGVAGWTLIADYLNPEQAAQLLYQASEGYGCLASYGNTVLSYGAEVTSASRTPRAEELAELIPKVEARLSGGGEAGAAARRALERARRVQRAYLQQRFALRNANARLYVASFEFGVDLARLMRRKQVDLAQLENAISQRMEQTREFSGLAETPAERSARAQAQANLNRVKMAAAGAASVKDLGSLTVRLIERTDDLLRDLPNIELLVTQFDECAAKALLGAPTPRPSIQVVSVDAAS